MINVMDQVGLHHRLNVFEVLGKITLEVECVFRVAK